MKKILLIIAFVFLIFQMVVLATAIDVGPDAINRVTVFGDDYTLINLENPANETGIITSVEIYANSFVQNCEVATFFLVSGSNYSTRDSVTLGNVASGSKVTFTVDSGSDPISLEVQAGDFIGMFYTFGGIERDLSGYAGVMYTNDDHIPCTNYGPFSAAAGNCISLHGIGATEEEEEEANAIFFGTIF